MYYGTAPRRVSPGVWITHSGRTLSAAGAGYWEHMLQTGRTDGQGHVRQIAPAGPRLEPLTKKPRPASQKELAEVRARVMADQAIRVLQPAIAASRRAAPGPAVSGYNFLSAAVGSPLAAEVPGVLTRQGKRPQREGGWAILDLLNLSPYGRGITMNYKLARALMARRGLREALRAGRHPRPWLAPMVRAGLRTDVQLVPEDRPLFTAPDDPNRLQLNPWRFYAGMKAELDRERAEREARNARERRRRAQERARRRRLAERP